MAQILSAMKDCVDKMKESKKNKDVEQLILLKKEMANLQKKFGETLHG